MMSVMKEGSDVSNLGLFVILVLVIGIIVIPDVRANVFDFLKEGFNSITGETVTSQSTSISITVGNDPPQVGNVSIASSWSVVNDPTSNKSIYFSFVVTDPQGSGNIDTASAIANITNGTGGGMVRHNLTSPDGGCVSEGAYGGASVNFSCTIKVMYYDTAMSWNISIYAEDQNGNSAQNNTVRFTLGETTSFSLSDSAISFPTATPSQENVTQSDGGIYMNNTGNDNIYAGSVNITAVDIHGDSNGATFIPAKNFTISTVGGSATNSCDISLSGVYRLVNRSISGTSAFNSTIVSQAVLPIGPAPHNQETLFLCLRHVPGDLTGQAYSTDTEDDWSVIIQ